MYKTFLPDLGVKWARLQSGWEKTERLVLELADRW